MTKQANAILGLLAQTAIHAGTGQNTGIIDLPIQREGHNGWPCIFGSAVKGAIRTRAEDHLMVDDQINDQADGQKKINPSIALVFGSESNETDSHSGSVAFSDARLLLFPVRSLTSQFKWVTCPAALKRYQKDAARLGQTIHLDNIPNRISDQKALVTGNADQALFLEEYRFTTQHADLTQTIGHLAALMQEDDASSLLAEQLTLISDDMFSYIVQHTTPVNAHIAIDSETKIVKNGALWYEESLPPESLLYTTLSAVKARKKDAHQSAENMLKVVTNLFTDEQAWLQLGGNETLGMGWCAVTIKTEA